MFVLVMSLALRPKQLSKSGDRLNESVVTKSIEDVTHGVGRILE